ncbi:MAG: hypothetical protein SangKO_011430 [Sandaracinaceae bacterium]
MMESRVGGDRDVTRLAPALVVALEHEDDDLVASDDRHVHEPAADRGPQLHDGNGA